MADDDNDETRDGRLKYISNELHRDRSHYIFIGAAVSAVFFGATVATSGASREVFSIVVVLAGLVGGMASYLYQQSVIQRLREEKDKIIREIQDKRDENSD